jgi:hypothetical protein
MMVLGDVSFKEVQLVVAIGVFKTKPVGKITIEGEKGFPT